VREGTRSSTRGDARSSLPAELFDLTDRTAAVIGGTGVLGSRFSRTLASAGAQVVVLGRSEARGRAAVDAIRDSGGVAHFQVLDVSDAASFVASTEMLQAFGGLDVLVNAPGRNGSTPFAQLDVADWNDLIDVNLTSVFRACQAFAPLMRDRDGSAAIINISSASSGPPLSRVLAYGVAKAGVDNLTQYLARELAPDRIRVNAIRPGFFPAEQNRMLLTDQRVSDILGHTPMNRLGEPHELDGALLWLASHRASAFVTGAVIPVDGGFSAMTI
jgi:NAD(P)-dependent dehydrogenase (short-subunit alcohol dehydrogenase family)